MVWTLLDLALKQIFFKVLRIVGAVAMCKIVYIGEFSMTLKKMTVCILEVFRMLCLKRKPVIKHCCLIQFYR